MNKILKVLAAIISPAIVVYLLWYYFYINQNIYFLLVGILFSIIGAIMVTIFQDFFKKESQKKQRRNLLTDLIIECKWNLREIEGVENRIEEWELLRKKNEEKSLSEEEAYKLSRINPYWCKCYEGNIRKFENLYHDKYFVFTEENRERFHEYMKAFFDYIKNSEYYLSDAVKRESIKNEIVRFKKLIETARKNDNDFSFNDGSK